MGWGDSATYGHKINAEPIGWMPKGSYLVNTARGEVVDTEAIPNAIAAIEPPHDDNPLLVARRDPNHASQRSLSN